LPHAQLERFRLVGEIDSYLDGLRSSIQGGDPLPPDVIEWVDWIAAYRDGIDPLKHPPVMPEAPDPSPEDLRPFLKGWNPYGPDSR
jgi:hypothetical protein